MVKFRDSESLQPLSGSVQSGGEKSVTTALYIMALQEMTEVPFRCVDEINQGMDEHNEKRVWELLVESAESHSAQFFYLALSLPVQSRHFGQTVFFSYFWLFFVNITQSTLSLYRSKRFHALINLVVKLQIGSTMPSAEL